MIDLGRILNPDRVEALPSAAYTPKPSMRFFEPGGRELLLDLRQDTSWGGWLFYRHVDGQWVSLRKATEADLVAMLRSIACSFPTAMISICSLEASQCHGK